nr:MAG TPA: hypothetical protein [Bacteriophage sp.]
MAEVHTDSRLTETFTSVQRMKCLCLKRTSKWIYQIIFNGEMAYEIYKIH